MTDRVSPAKSLLRQGEITISLDGRRVNPVRE